MIRFYICCSNINIIKRSHTSREDSASTPECGGWTEYDLQKKKLDVN